MWPDPADLFTWVWLGLLLLLLAPKHGPRRIAARFAETRRGERRYVFGPPVRQGQLADSLSERWIQLVQREWARIVELGLPLYVSACLAEQRGARRRRERLAAWARSPAGPLLDHLTGNTSEDELHARLEEDGYPLPPAKLAATPPREYLLPPMSWLRDWRREQQAVAAPITATPTPAPAPRLEIRALGELRLLAGGEDLAAELSRKPVLGFIWVYLLAVHARRPGDRLARSDLGDELFPTYRPTEQRKKVRQRISDLMGNLPAPLRDCVRVEEDHLSLDLSDCAFDVRAVLDLADQIRRDGGLRTEAMLEQAHDALSRASEEFLPRWDEIERKGTLGRGVAGGVVADVRRLVATAHVTILVAIADWYLAQRRPQRAVAYLEDGLRLRSDRPEIADRLATAYEQVGQPGRAAGLREEYGLDQPADAGWEPR